MYVYVTSKLDNIAVKTRVFGQYRVLILLYLNICYDHIDVNQKHIIYYNNRTRYN